MRPSSTRRRATALVITVGLLAVLAVIGFGFAVLMKLQHTTAGYFQASASVDMLSHAVFTYAVRDIRHAWSNGKAAQAGLLALKPYPTGAISMATESPQNPWYSAAGMDYDPNSGVADFVGWGLYRDSSSGLTRGRYCNLACNSYALVHNVLGDRIAISCAKVLDAASKINLNDDFDNARLTAILDTLLDELMINDATIDSSPTSLSASTLVSNRPANGYPTLDELRDLSGMTPRRFDVLKHYVTVYSWPHDPPSVQGFTPWNVHPDGSGGLDATRDKRRSPININTAPPEVLVAVIANIKARNGSYLKDIAGMMDKIRRTATWIVRKRDPENRAHWPNSTFHGTWNSWLIAAAYSANTSSVRTRSVQGWRAYPIGPFDCWNEVVDFLYGLTDPASTGVADDPFPAGETAPLTADQAETILAAVNPNTSPTLVPRNTYHMAWTRLRKDHQVEQRLRKGKQSDPSAVWIRGTNDLASSGYTLPFCFSSMGRFEIFSRTFAFTKADVGLVNTASNYALACSGKAWGTTPAQWRGYSVLIYDGQGKGQLRGIVNNTANTLTVAKWSTALATAGDNRSRFYILGPGALLDRVGAGISVVSTSPHILRDNGAGSIPIDWENDQWNGYRVVVYRTDAAGSAVYDDTIQERIIIDTVHHASAADELILSPELDTRLSQGSAWAYIILGSYGNVAHDAALKAYDVIHHTSQKDFAPGNSLPAGSAHVVAGPNPLDLNVASAEEDGWLAVETEDSQVTHFKLDFDNPSLQPTAGVRIGGNVASAVDLFNGGCITPEGIYLPDNSTKYITYRTADNMVTSGRDDGGFVAFWFRPDQECLDGTTRTLLRIKGLTAQADIRVVIDATKNLKVIVRQDDVTYGSLNIRPGPALRTVKYRIEERYSAPYSVQTEKWQAGEWHYIAFAWYECYKNQVVSEGTGADEADHVGIETENPARLDPHPQMSGAIRLWVDGNDTGLRTVDAFNINPPADGGYLCIGDSSAGVSPAGTLDGIIAKQHNDRNLNPGTIGVTIAKPNARYYGYPTRAWGYYQSPAISFPSAISGKPLCLGTVTWTGWQPYYGTNPWATWKTDYNNYPIYVTVTLGGTSTAMPLKGANYQPINSGGEALRTGSAIDRHMQTTIRTSSANSLSYKVWLQSYHGDDDTNPNATIFKYYQTALLDDITITYLGPVTLFHWR